MKLDVTRRSFLKATSVGFLAAQLPTLVWRRLGLREAWADISRPRFFTDPDYRTIETMVDRLIPPDFDANEGIFSPGAKDAKVADYIDFLLGAFLASQPFIIADGPFSDRNPDPLSLRQTSGDDMANPLALTDSQKLQWLVLIRGTIGAEQDVPAYGGKIDILRNNNKIAGVGDPSTGDLPGYQQQYTDGIKAFRDIGFADLPAPLQDAALERPDQQGFVSLVYEHAVEGMYANPEYGGNQPPDRNKPASGADGDNRPIGWQNAFFEGDRQPLGYTIFEEDGKYHELPNHPVSRSDTRIPDLLVLDPETMKDLDRIIPRLRVRR